MTAAALQTNDLVLLREKRRRAARKLATPVWTPQHRPDCDRTACTCPQPQAYESPADILGYGGAAGGGKTDLALGLAGTAHRHSIIFRRVFPELRGMIERSREIFNADQRVHEKDSFNESLHVWRLADGRMIEFGAMQRERDKRKHQGQPRDLFVFDEATEFTETQVRFAIGWNRTTVPGQRCRVVLTFNPPMEEGEAWVVRFFAPWLDPEHPNPAQDGELRYFATVDGKEVERPDGEPFTHDGEVITPKSRTFFHASLKDNPILAATGYGATIDSLPEPLRSLLKGNFDAAKTVNPWQVIPLEWIKLAQKRWLEREPPAESELTAIGLDVARGGKDQTVKAKLYGTWFAPLQKVPGVATPDGPSAAALVVPDAADQVPINVDVIGIGSSCYDSLKSQDLPARPINFSEAAPLEARDRSGRMKFRNFRAYAYWTFREALDPNHGEGLALPPDPELAADLCAPTWSLSTSGILIESKEEIIERLGRSPDSGDAAVLAKLPPPPPEQPSGHVALPKIVGAAVPRRVS